MASKQKGQACARCHQSADILSLVERDEWVCRTCIKEIIAERERTTDGFDASMTELLRA